MANTDVTLYSNEIDLMDMTGSAAPTNAGAIYYMSGALNFNSGMIMSSSATYAIDVATGNGAIRADEFVTYSDAGLKTNIQPIDGALNKVMQLQAITYDKIATGKNEIGFLAQDVAKIIPEICAIDKSGEGRGIDYSRLTSVLVGAVKAQQEQLKSQEKQIDEFEKFFTFLQKQLDY